MKKLNIACGHRTIEGYINADINPNLPKLDLICSMEEIPAESNSFDEVFASHCIEHVSPATARIALKEWCRILKPGGFAIIDTPNLVRNISLYLHGGWESDFATLTPEEREYCSFGGAPNKTLWLIFKQFSSTAQWDVHFANYDADLLAKFCLDAGFSRVEIAQLSPSLMVRAYK